MALVSTQVAFIDSSPTTTTTIDITDVDTFAGETPKAAILTYIQAGGDDQAAYTQSDAVFNGGDGASALLGNSRMGGVIYGIGAMAESGSVTNQWSCSIAIEGHTVGGAVGYSRTCATRRQSADHVICTPWVGNSWKSSTYYDKLGAESTGSFITNGIRLTHNPSDWDSHDNGSCDLLVEVTLLGGDDFEAYCTTGHGGTVTPPSSQPGDGTRNITGIPFLPNFAMFGNAWPGWANGSTGLDKTYEDAHLSQGWLKDDGSGGVTQACRMMHVIDDISNIVTRTRMEDDYFMGVVSDNTVEEYNFFDHTSFNVLSGGSTYEHEFEADDSISAMSQNYMHDFGSLYMKFDNGDCYLKKVNLSNSTGTKTISTGLTAGSDGGTAVQKIFGAGDIPSYSTTYDAYGGLQRGNYFDWSSGGGPSTSIGWNIISANQTESNPSFMEFSIDGFRSFGGQYTNSTSTFVDQYGSVANEVARIPPSLFGPGGLSYTLTTAPANTTRAFVLGLGTPIKSPTINVGAVLMTPYLGPERIVTASLGNKLQHNLPLYKTIWYNDPIQTSHVTWVTDAATITNVTGGVKIEWGTTANGHVYHSIPCEPNTPYKLEVTISADTRTSTCFLTFGNEITSGGLLKTQGYTHSANPRWSGTDKIPLSDYLVTSSSGAETIEVYIYSVGEVLFTDFWGIFQAEGNHLTIESIRLWKLW